MKIDINDDVFKDLFRESMEEFSIEESFEDVIEAYFHFKKKFLIVLQDFTRENSRHFRQFQSNARV